MNQDKINELSIKLTTDFYDCVREMVKLNEGKDNVTTDEFLQSTAFALGTVMVNIQAIFPDKLKKKSLASVVKEMSKESFKYANLFIDQCYEHE